MIRIAPSVLATDFARLGEQVAAAARGGADLIHCDIMDGSFVPAISFGPDVVGAVGRSCDAPLDVHLMVSSTLAQVEMLAPFRPSIITFHLEAVDDPLAVCRRIRAAGARVGAAIKPATSADRLLEILAELDLALIMTVEPGRGGQPFMRETLPKITYLANAIRDSGREVMLEVDGGIGLETIAQAAGAGADTFVAGTSVFRSPEGIAAAIVGLRKAAAGTAS